MKAWVCDVCNKTIRKNSKEKVYALLVKERDWFDNSLGESPYGHIDICEDCLGYLLEKRSDENDLIVEKLEDLSDFLRKRFNVENESTNM